MKKVFLSLLLLLSVTITFGQDWIDYKSTELGFAVNFPEEPSITSQMVPTEVGDIEMKLVMMDMSLVNDSKNIFYSVILSHYPKELFENATDVLKDETLDNAANGGLANSGGTLVYTKKVQFAGYPGREMKIEITGMYLYMNLYLVENTIYINQVICYLDNDKNTDIERFQNSFKLL